MIWKKTARGLWETKDGSNRARVEHDNGFYVWEVGGNGETLRGVQRLKKDAVSRAESELNVKRNRAASPA